MKDFPVAFDLRRAGNSLSPSIDRGDEAPRAPQPAESKQKAATHKILFVMGESPECCYGRIGSRSIHSFID